jgi:hypothetical protein
MNRHNHDYVYYRCYYYIKVITYFKPKARNSRTECCAGLVFCSPTEPKTGTNAT